MTSYSTYEKYQARTIQIITEEFGNDAWRSTSFLIAITHKIEQYFDHLVQGNPDDDKFYRGYVAFQACCRTIDSDYTVPAEDARADKVRKVFMDTIEDFITNHSDDATADVMLCMTAALHISRLRVEAFDQTLQNHFDSDVAHGLKLAKRDRELVLLCCSVVHDLFYSEDLK